MAIFSFMLVFASMVAGHQGEATVDVHSLNARLSLLETENEQLRDQLNQVITEQMHTRMELNHTKIELTQLKVSHAGLANQVQSIDDRARQKVGFQVWGIWYITRPKDTPMCMPNIIYNVANAYNSSTGYFTATIPGLYLFMATAGPVSNIFGSTRARHQIFVDNGICGYADSFRDAQAHQDMNTAHCVVPLTRGQRVWLKSDGKSDFDGSRTLFSGALLSPDP